MKKLTGMDRDYQDKSNAEGRKEECGMKSILSFIHPAFLLHPFFFILSILSIPV
jgi:hypothetical protein